MKFVGIKLQLLTTKFMVLVLNLAKFDTKKLLCSHVLIQLDYYTIFKLHRKSFNE